MWKKEEEVHPTETKTTVIEVDKDKSTVDNEKEKLEEDNNDDDNYLKNSDSN